MTARELALPSIDLGRVVSAPAQSAPISPRQRFRLRLSELERHVLLIGTTGSGKTTTLARLADAALAADWSVLVVDGNLHVVACCTLTALDQKPGVGIGLR